MTWLAWLAWPGWPVRAWLIAGLAGLAGLTGWPAWLGFYWFSVVSFGLAGLARLAWITCLAGLGAARNLRESQININKSEGFFCTLPYDHWDAGLPCGALEDLRSCSLDRDRLARFRRARGGRRATSGRLAPGPNSLAFLGGAF